LNIKPSPAFEANEVKHVKNITKAEIPTRIEQLCGGDKFTSALTYDFKIFRRSG
jgi:hypothetical protein